MTDSYIKALEAASTRYVAPGVQLDTPVIALCYAISLYKQLQAAQGEPVSIKVCAIALANRFQEDDGYASSVEHVEQTGLWRNFVKMAKAVLDAAGVKYGD